MSRLIPILPLVWNIWAVLFQPEIDLFGIRSLQSRGNLLLVALPGLLLELNAVAQALRLTPVLILIPYPLFRGRSGMLLIRKKVILKRVVWRNVQDAVWYFEPINFGKGFRGHRSLIIFVKNTLDSHFLVLNGELWINPMTKTLVGCYIRLIKIQKVLCHLHYPRKRVISS